MYKLKYYRMDQEEKRRVVEKLREALLAESIRLAILFGSFIEMESFRDIDIAVYLEDPQDLDRVLEIGVRLEEKLGIPIDIAPLQSLPPRFRLKVLTKGLPIIEEPGLYEAMLIQTLDELVVMNPSDEQ